MDKQSRKEISVGLLQAVVCFLKTSKHSVVSIFLFCASAIYAREVDSVDDVINFNAY